MLGVERVGTFRSEVRRTHHHPHTTDPSISRPSIHALFNSIIQKENVDEDILRLGASNSPWAVEVDLMQPIDPTKAPKVHIPPLNHIGLWIDDLAAAYMYLGARGVRFTPGGIRKGASGHDVCFIHPKGNEASPLSGEGVLIELVQAPPAVVAAYEGTGGNKD